MVLMFLKVEYLLEPSNYFLDNGRLTARLMIKIEDLAWSNGIPTEGQHVEPIAGTHIWHIDDHTIVYEIDDDTLTVLVVKPD